MTAGAVVRRRHPSGPVIGCTLLLLTAGCSLPTQEQDTPDAPAEAPIGSTAPDPAREALDIEVERLRTVVGEARDALAEALEVDLLTRAHQAATDSHRILVSGEAATGDDPALFPSQSPGRDEDDTTDDQLTTTLTAAREVGGPTGTTVVDLLRDPVAGDLGAWQRDAAGVLESITATTREASELTGLEAAIAALPGLGTQAVAWVELAAAAGTLDDARAYAERGLASLDVILVSIDRLEVGAATTDAASRSGEPDDPADLDPDDDGDDAGERP